jgi:nitroreductase
MSTYTNDNIRFLRGLRAVRDYTSDPIPDDVLNDILEVGRWSGSASNVQGNEVVVVRDRAILQRMSEVGVRPAAGAAAALVVVMNNDEARRDLDSFDNGRLVERLLLAAKAVGVGSNIATLKEDGPDVIKEALGIPPEKRIWTVVTLGYTDEAAHKARPKSPTAGRKPATTFVHHDRY